MAICGNARYPWRLVAVWSTIMALNFMLSIDTAFSAIINKQSDSCQSGRCKYRPISRTFEMFDTEIWGLFIYQVEQDISDWCLLLSSERSRSSRWCRTSVDSWEISRRRMGVRTAETSQNQLSDWRWTMAFRRAEEDRERNKKIENQSWNASE